MIQSGCTLKEMGNVELLSRVGEIEIAKRIESRGKRKTSRCLFKKLHFSMEVHFQNIMNEYSSS